MLGHVLGRILIWYNWLVKRLFAFLILVLGYFLTSCTLTASIEGDSSSFLEAGPKLKIVQDTSLTFSTPLFDDHVRFKVIATEPLKVPLETSMFKQVGTAKGLIFKLSPTSLATEYTLDVVVSSSPGTVEIEIPAESVQFADEEETKNESAVSDAVDVTQALTTSEFALGEAVTCYIDKDKTVRCVGYSYAGQMGDGTEGESYRGVGIPIDTSLFEGSVEIKKVAAHEYGTCVLNHDGKIYCWGDNYEGESGAGASADSNLLIPTPVLTDNITGEKKFLDVSAGYENTCAITEDQRLYCWGQMMTSSFAEPQVVDLTGLGPSVKVGQVGVGKRFACGLSQYGKVFCFGKNDVGQLGNNSTDDSLDPVWIDESNFPEGTLFRHISVGQEHVCAISFAGELYCWGNNYVGQVGDGTTTMRLVPTAADRSLVPADEVFVKVYSGLAVTCAISQKGTSYCFGDNGYYTVGSGSEGGELKPTPVDVSGLPGNTKFKQIAAHYYRSCGLTTGQEIACWGQEGDYMSVFRERSPTEPYEIPTSVLPTGETWKTVSSEENFMCATSSDDTAYCWGYGLERMGVGVEKALEPTPVDTTDMSGAKTFSGISVGKNATCGVATDGILYCWGHGYKLGLGAVTMIAKPTAVLTSAMTGATQFAQVSVSDDHACGVATDGVGYCWGGTTSSASLDTAALGNGVSAIKDKPYPVSVGAIPGSKLFTKIITSPYHSCGLMTDGKVYCWGSKSWSGGHNSLNMAYLPQALDTSLMTGDTTFTDISGRYQTMCGTSTDGVAYCWGYNNQYQLGAGEEGYTINLKAAPVIVSGISSPLAVGSMNSFMWASCGVLTAGQIYCWGNFFPLPSEKLEMTPVAMNMGAGLNGTIGVLEGKYNLFTVTSTGHLYCWGYDCNLGLPRIKPSIQSYTNFK